MIIPFIFFFTMFILAPLVFIIVRSFLDDTYNFTLENYLSIAKEVYIRAVECSIRVATYTSLISLILGSILAYIIARLSPLHRDLVLSILTLPLTYSGLIIAFSFVLLFGDTGMVTNLLRLFNADLKRFFYIYSLEGLMAAYIYFEIPVITLTMTSAILTFDKTLIEAARSLGASPLRTAFSIVVPNILPAILACITLVYAMAIGAYGTALALVGGSVNILTLQIYSWISDVAYNPGLASSLSVVALLLTIPLTVLYRILIKKGAMRWI